MTDPQPVNPLGPGYGVRPISGGAQTTVWQIALALGVLYLFMKYIPGGLWWGLLLLTSVFLSTPAGVSMVAGALHFLEYGG